VEVRKLLQAVEQSANSILITDARGLITYVNPAFEKTYGHSRESVLGQTPRFLKSGQHDRAFYEQFWKKLLGGESVRQEFINRKKNGELVTVEAVVNPVFDARKKLVGYIGVQDDVTERKRSERALQESEERFRRAFSASPVGMTISESGSGLILDANERFARMLGYSREELIGRNSIGMGIWVDPKERERVVEAIEASLPVREFHARFRTKTGDIRDVLDSVEPLLMGSKRVLLSVFQDVTDLRKSEQRFARAFHANPVPTSISEAETGRILDVNDQFLKVLGYSRSQLLGHSSTELGIWATPEDRLRVGHRVLADGAIYNEEVNLRSSSGDIRTVVGSIVRVQLGSMPCMLSTFVDITERKRADKERLRAEEEKRESEERYRVIFDASPLPTWLFETPSLKIYAVNQAAIDFYGYSREEFRSMTLYDLRSPAEAERLRTLYAETPRPETRWNPGVWEHRKKDGTLVLMDIHTHEVQVSGRPMRLAVQIDVTGQRRLEEQLRQSQKMEAVGQLAGGIAHDFNNILTTILGYGSLALERVDRQDPLFEEILEIQRAGERAAELTKKLLAFSRKQILEPRVIDLNETVSGVERMLRRTIGENVRLVFRPASGLGRVRADPSQVEQVLLNLAVNARDAMPAGGSLTIETANVELDGEFAQTHPEVRMSGEFVVLAVSDSGTGMDEATRARIFEPFFTTKELGKGTGLGLSTVYGIVKQSGGYVWCYSEPGAGTVFKIYLPRVAEDASNVAPRPATADLRGSETILLVEDEETLANLARRVLLKQGYRVLTASSGAAAREVAAEHPGIDLLLTDVVMPGMSGRDLADELQRRFPGLKVLFMSGYTDDAIVHQGFLDPGLAFLQKPFTPDGLARKVREVLRRAS